MIVIVLIIGTGIAFGAKVKPKIGPKGLGINGQVLTDINKNPQHINKSCPMITRVVNGVPTTECE